MASSGQIHWHEGLFLQPHHLQWAQRQTDAAMVELRRTLTPYPYGVVEAKVSQDELENRLVRFDRLRVVMPRSGLLVEVPDSADLPPLDIARDFGASTAPLTIELGVPVWQAAAANAIEPGPDQDPRTARLFRVNEIERPDENTGANPQPVRIRRINARLLLPGDDRNGLDTIPVVRVVHDGGQATGMPRVDPAFAPPCMLMAGSPRLQETLRNLANLLDARRKEGAADGRRALAGADALRPSHLQTLLLLRSLSSAAGVLLALADASGVTPFEVYLRLRATLGELAALSPDPGRDNAECAPYSHDQPLLCLKDLAARIERLSAGGPRREFAQAVFAPANGVLVAQLSEDQLSRPTGYFLAIRTAQTGAAVAGLVTLPERFVLTAPSLTRHAAAGVPLVEERDPPHELPPAKAGLYYFRLNHQARQIVWDQIRADKAMVLKWTGQESSDFQCTLYMPLPGG